MPDPQAVRRWCTAWRSLPEGNFGSGTSIGSNYREANRAVSRNDFVNKIGIVEKESAETEYWLQLFDESNIGNSDERRWLLQESGELLAIFTSIGKTSKSRR